MTLTVEMILKGTGIGPMQSVGQMQVIPIVAPADATDDDATYAPPQLEVGTSCYGSVALRNANDKPTIVPYGAGWVVEERAQDHAIGSGAFLQAGEHKVLGKAMCIQQSQPGLIARAKRAMTILPAKLRAKALAVRHVEQYNKLWEHITAFNTALGIDAAANLVTFLRSFAKELDEFVAEFELVPRQIGAIVLVGGEIVGVERAPSAAYFAATWEPLVRVCYGSLAIAAGRSRATPPATRLPLITGAKTLEALRSALAELRTREEVLTQQLMSFVRPLRLERADRADDTLDDAQLWTVAGMRLGGQVVIAGDAVKYASLVAAN
ncbi:MAG: hypothetical protein HYV09_06735 [Deltaproteobacteria bacterium]|nr:hypothetical protein [Deltaproteobacteria bacterium]